LLLAPLDLHIGGGPAGSIKLPFRKLNSTSCEQRRRTQPLINVAKMPAELEELRAPLIVVGESRNRASRLAHTSYVADPALLNGFRYGRSAGGGMANVAIAG
jgi:hypothetical protein